MLSPIEEQLVELLRMRKGAHTVLLYGSRALGTARPDSDWDLLAFHDGKRPGWLHETVEGIGEVNAYLYPAAGVMANIEGMLNLTYYAESYALAKILCEEAGLGQYVIEQARLDAPRQPALPPAGFAQNIRHFYRDIVLKAVRDAQVPVAIRHYRLHESLVKSLAHYRMFRGLRLSRIRESIRWMEEQDPHGHGLYSAAVAPGASAEAVAAWLDHVLVVTDA